jgi:flagellar basal-body rod modification protein FlgD
VAVSSVSNQKTIQEIIDQTRSSTNSRNTGELGKDDFLNLMVTQLKYQDPLQPTDDKEFIGQMAQFSALEQMQNMNTSLSNSQAFSLIGKHVTANTVDKKTAETKVTEGEVTSVKVKSGKSYVVVNGEDIAVDKIVNVSDSARTIMSASNIANYTNLIGFNAKGAVYDATNGQIVGVNSKVTSIARGAYEDYAVMDGVKVEISGLVTDKNSTASDFVTSYLNDHLPDPTNSKYVDTTINVYITDRATGAKVPITANLKSYTKDANGNISAVLDQVYVPVDSISKISTVAQD